MSVTENEDAIGSSARAMDHMIVTHLKARYRMFYMVTTPMQSCVDLVKNSTTIPEYDTYIPCVGEDESGEFREPTKDEYVAAFHRLSKNNIFGGRDLNMYLKGIDGTKFFCKIMKYLIQTGVTPLQFINNKLTDLAEADDDNKAETRREVTDFIKKITYDYFRMAPPDRDDHLHVDPIALTCAVLDRARTSAVMLALNKIGLDMPAGLVKAWENKMKSSRQSEMQLENNIKSLDPADRDDASESVKAVENAPDRSGYATSGQSGSASNNQEASKRRRSR
jgi:hypothetical protein